MTEHIEDIVLARYEKYLKDGTINQITIAEETSILLARLIKQFDRWNNYATGLNEDGSYWKNPNKKEEKK
jgi:hypothetical protein